MSIHLRALGSPKVDGAVDTAVAQQGPLSMAGPSPSKRAPPSTDEYDTMMSLLAERELNMAQLNRKAAQSQHEVKARAEQHAAASPGSTTVHAKSAYDLIATGDHQSLLQQMAAARVEMETRTRESFNQSHHNNHGGPSSSTLMQRVEDERQQATDEDRLIAMAINGFALTARSFLDLDAAGQRRVARGARAATLHVAHRALTLLLRYSGHPVTDAAAQQSDMSLKRRASTPHESASQGLGSTSTHRKRRQSDGATQAQAARQDLPLAIRTMVTRRAGEEHVAANSAIKQTDEQQLLEAKTQAENYTRTYLQVLCAELKTLRLQVDHGHMLRERWLLDPEQYSYVPVPVQVGALYLPAGLEQIVDAASAKMHQYWVESQIEKGVKGDPRLVPFEQLAEDHRALNITQASNGIKLMVALGHHITKVAEGDPRLVESTEPWLGLVELLAAHSHEAWSQKKMADGYKYGPRRSDSGDMRHPHLVPFCVLSGRDQEYDRTTSENLVRSILAAGYHISVESDGGLLSLADSDLSRSSTTGIDFRAAREAVVEVAEHGADNLRVDPADVEMANVLRHVDDGKRYKRLQLQRMGGSKNLSEKKLVAHTLRRSQDCRRKSSMGIYVDAAHKLFHVHMPNKFERFVKRVVTTLRSPRQACRHSQTLVFHPESTYMNTWHVVIMLMVLWSGITVPIQMGFRTMKDDTPAKIAMQIVIEVTFLFDIAQNFRVAFVDEATHQLIKDPRRISRRYLRGWFCVDVAGSIPAEIISQLTSAASVDLNVLKIVRVLKLVRLVRLLRLQVLDGVFKLIGKPSVIRLVKYLFALLGVCHGCACVYAGCTIDWDRNSAASTTAYGCDNVNFDRAPWGGWIMSGLADDDRRWHLDKCQPFAVQYPLAFYWSLLALLGSDMYPQNVNELWLSISAALLGVAVVSTIIGSFSSTLTSLDAVAEEHESQMSRVSTYMRRQGVNRKLQDKVLDFFNFVYRTGALRPELLFDALPPALRVQFDMAVKLPLIEKSPMFNNLQVTHTAALVRRLQTCVLVPDQVVTTAGMRGDRMYFVDTGRLQYFTEVAGMVAQLDEIDDGQLFGSDALFSQGHVHTRSTISVTHCVLESLAFDDLVVLMGMYNDIKDQVLLIAEQFDKEQHSTDMIHDSSHDFEPQVSEWQRLSGNRPRLRHQWLPVVLDSTALKLQMEKREQYSRVVDRSVESWRQTRQYEHDTSVQTHRGSLSVVSSQDPTSRRKSTSPASRARRSPSRVHPTVATIYES